MRAFLLINRLSRGPRWLLKGLFLAMVLLAVTYPKPAMLVRAARHAFNMNALIDGEAPELDPLRAELERTLQGVDPGAHAERLSAVEQLVIERVPYEWDWNTWGVAEYTPTVAEVMAQGREDCDGRAVVAASLLKGLGYEPQLVTDLVHVWVWTGHGELMQPRGPKLMEPVDGGRRFNAASMLDWPTSVAVGLAVFPLVREIPVLAALWLVGISPFRRPWTWLVALLLLSQGLILIRQAVGDASRIVHWAVWLGWANVAVALAVLWFGPQRRVAWPVEAP